MTIKCRICASAGDHTTFRFREKMFGMGDEFSYFQCRECGCLQISEFPQSLGRYYPANYYSFRHEPLPNQGTKAWLASKRDLAAVTGRGLIGRLLAQWMPARSDLACLGALPLKKEMRILDVGCGKGQLLNVLYRAGFRGLEGIDPYLAADFEILPGLLVRKEQLRNLKTEFDVIMLHHVFEHVEDGRQMLADCQERLAAGGRIVLRMPVVDSAAWQRYQENWVQLDAPRHLFLHTRHSLTQLARQVGLELVSQWSDSGPFQFWGSELYQRGIALMNAQGVAEAPETYFSAEKLKAFVDEAIALNASNRGDQIVAVLARSTDQAA